MAKDWRTLKLEILAETKQFVTDMKKGEDTVESFGDKATKMGKVAAAAFAAAAAAAAAYAGKLAIEGVKAAIEDEAAQKRLALALQNVTGATEAQIAAVEEQISKTALATGFSSGFHGCLTTGLSPRATFAISSREARLPLAA